MVAEILEIRTIFEINLLGHDKMTLFCEHTLKLHTPCILFALNIFMQALFFGIKCSSARKFKVLQN